MKLATLIRTLILIGSSLLSTAAYAQVSLALASGNATAGGSVSLNLSLTSILIQPAGLQWTFSFPTSDFTAMTVVAGSSATTASKTLICNGANGIYTCLLVGANSNTLPNGVVATATLTLSSSANPLRTIQVTDAISTSSIGNHITTLATGGAVIVPVSLPIQISSLTCTPSSFSTSGSAICTVGLNAPAPAGGAVVTLSDNSTFVTTPASVTVGVGASTAIFTASVSAATATTTAVVTATLNGIPANASLTLFTQAVPSSLTCSPSSLSSGATTTCTVTLTKAAPSGGLLVSVSDNSAALSVPSSVSVAAGNSSVTFTAAAGAVSTPTDVTITASANGTSRTALVTVTSSSPAQISGLACNPSSVSAGATTTCTVTLKKAAPSGGLLVSVSDNSPALTVPSSVTVVAGNLTATFAATAGSTYAPTVITITVSANGTSKTALVTVTSGPAQISGLACSPASVSSDATTACTVSLTKIAPSGGLLVSVSDNSPALTVPSSVTVVAGNLTAAFTATAGTVTTPQTVVVTATLNSVSKTASLSLSSITTACPCSVWKPSDMPSTISDPDTTAVELGMKFRSSIAGYVVGIRFYKGWQNTGTHNGKLWTKGGTLLASINFSGETSSGWQQANFSTPVAIAANTTYVVSYWTWASHYSVNDGYFGSSGVTNGPLYALRDGEDGSNGVYKYSSSAFPTTTWNSSNYWVDVVFNTVPSLNPAAAPSIISTLLTEELSVQRAASTMEPESMTAAVIPAAATPAAAGARSLYCSPKSVQAGDSFTCQLELASDDGPSSIPVAASSSDVRLPATIQARAQQRLLTFHGIVDQAAPPSTFAISVGDGGDRAEDQITVSPSLTPVLSLPETQIVKVGQPISFHVSARDPSGLPAQISASELPDGASFQQDSQSFQWSPAPNQEGDHTLAFTAVNSSGYSSNSQVQIVVDSGKPVVRTAAPAQCSPGSIATLEGRWFNLANENLTDLSGSSLELGGTKVRVNNEFAPVLFASQTRVDFLCPNAAPGTSLEIAVITPDGTTVPVQTTMLAARPQFLRAQDLGATQAMVNIAGTARVATARNYHGVGEPARTDDVVSLRVTGMGLSDSLALSIFVKVGGIDAQVESIVPSPDAAGVSLLHVRIPMTAPLGDEIPVSLELLASDGKRHSSNVVTLAIE